MNLAIKLARRGRTSPNPMVGAVVVKDGIIVGKGYHHSAGEPHAEALALDEAGEQAAGASMYVTLEPCCHTGRTPPCVGAIIRAGIKRVCVAMEDPDSKVAGMGLAALKQAGIEVECGLMQEQARALNEAYIKHRTTGMPLVILKSAMSLDGRIATRTGDSKWITSEPSRAFAHKIRRDVDAIVVGANTARMDNPKLTARVGRRVYYPTRVVVSETGNIASNLALFGLPGQSIVAVSKRADRQAIQSLEQVGARIIVLKDFGDRASIADLMRQLADLGCLSALIEGGGELAASALEEKIVDKIMFFYAPKIIGGRDAISSIGGAGVETVSQSVRIRQTKIRRIGDGFMVEGYVNYAD